MRNQATKLDVIKAQEERRRRRLDLLLAIPTYGLFGAICAYALAGMLPNPFTP